MEFNLKIKKENNNNFILEDDENNLITWPKNKTPNNVKIGDNLKISINQSLAKEILNELLKTTKKEEKE